MNDDYSFYTSRRHFMTGTGSLVALGSLPGYLTANEEALNSLHESPAQNSIVMYRPENTHSVTFARVLQQAGYESVELKDDPVRQWRDQLSQAVCEDGAALAGLTGWTDYLMLSGLAVEARKHVLLEMQHPVEQAEYPQWPAELALSLLQMPGADNSDNKKKQDSVQAIMREALSTQRAITPGELTLFSWVIA